MIGVCSIICDRKKESQLIGIPRMFELEGDCAFYINIETSELSSNHIDNLYAPLYSFLQTQQRPWDVDIWGWKSTFRRNPEYDQDQRRLAPIVVARNMAIDFGLMKDMSHLLYVDADVIVPKNAITLMLEADKPIVCGKIPGRGVHNSSWYMSGTGEGIRPLPDRPHLVEVDHASAGCMLIRKDIYTCLRWRWGGHRIHQNTFLSEDPAYSSDARLNTGIRTVVDTRVVCQHIDNPLSPLTQNAIAIDTWETIRR